MDALRKAELEKKEAAKRLEETAGHEKLEEGGQSDPGTPARPPGETSTEQPITRLDRTLTRSKEEIFAATSELSLEPIEAALKKARQDSAIEDIAAQEDSESPTQPIPVEPTPETGAEETISEEDFPLEITSQHLHIDDYKEQGADDMMDKTLHGVSLDTEKEVLGLYDETIQEEAYQPEDNEGPYDETLPGIPAVELAKDLGEEHQPTPVAAETVFTASATTKAAYGFKWPVIIGLAVVVIIAFSIIVYQAVTPLNREIPTQQLGGDLALLDKSVPEIQLPAPETTPADQAGTVNGSVSPGGEQVENNITEQETGVDDTQVQIDETGDALLAGQVEEESDTTAVPAEPVAAVSMTDESPAPPPAAVPQKTGTEPALFKISRSKAPDERGRTIMEAYTAYKNGDYSSARTKYEEVLKNFPDNRDALLGMGAIAMREGDFAKSFDIYSHLFRLNPHDSVARSVLINFNKQADYVNRESTLKIMISDHPDDAYLYFSLGNVYAAQSRWPEAQQAFFNAYKNDSGNPDYALNLAVSLDHLGQWETAIDYYDTALRLSDEQAAGFDSANILARIQYLKTRSVN